MQPASLRGAEEQPDTGHAPRRLHPFPLLRWVTVDLLHERRQRPGSGLQRAFGRLELAEHMAKLAIGLAELVFRQPQPLGELVGSRDQSERHDDDARGHGQGSKVKAAREMLSHSLYSPAREALDMACWR